MTVNFLSTITGSFATPCAENPTVAMVEAAYAHHGIDARYINCDVQPEALGDAVRGARAMGWAGFNCSLPHKVAVIEHLDGARLASFEADGAMTLTVPLMFFFDNAVQFNEASGDSKPRRRRGDDVLREMAPIDAVTTTLRPGPKT